MTDTSTEAVDKWLSQQGLILTDPPKEAEASKLVRALLKERDQLKAENERLREYAIEATKAITGLTIGGSEFFVGQKLGFYQADIKTCVDHIHWRFENARKLGEARARAALEGTST